MVKFTVERGTAMTKLKHTFKTDILFKLLFTKNPELLKRLVAQLLGITLDSITQFEIRNPEMTPEIIGKKFSRLDIVMTVDGQQVDLEVQVENESDYPERVMFYWARLFSNSLPAGGNYSELPRTIIVSIIDFILFECEEFRSEYQALEVSRHTPLSNKMAYYFYELPKLPKAVGGNDLLLLWLALFKADTEEELKQIQALGVPELTEAITAYHSVAASPEFLELERMRTKAQHDEAQALYNERRKEKIEIARCMLAEGEHIDKVMRYTGLTRAEIENLCDTDK